MPHYFEKLDLSDYDLVVSSAHACAAGVRAGPGAVHVCYCHTPIRYIWLPETERERVRGVAGLGLRLSRRWLVRRDLAASRRPGSYVANSSAVRDRIRYFYGRDATVIHPPVDTARLRPSRVRENGHFLWVNRLTAYKQPLVVAEAFRGLPFRLTMVGVGPLESALRKSRPPNVEVLGWLDDDRLVELFEGATGFVHVGEEDFGISMVEALAAGTPVVALSRGGAVDIVRHGTDGVLIAEPTVRAVRDAVMETARRTWDRPSLAERAALFSRERFAEQFGAHLAAILGSPTPIRRSADERRQRGGFRGRPE
jgi:glycosyltransferase involved in cell wall biosynthesis